MASGSPQAARGVPGSRRHGKGKLGRPAGVNKRRQQAGGKGDGADKKHTSQRDKIRLLQHLLKKDDLEDKARDSAQRQLHVLLANQAEAKRVEKERKLAARYHKVRFFERVKLERHIAQLQRLAAAGGPGLTAEQQQQLEQWQADLQYVKHFPPGEKYVALLRQADTPEAQAQLDAERSRLRALVAERVRAAAQAAADVAALTEADEGRHVTVLQSVGATARLGHGPTQQLGVAKGASKALQAGKAVAQNLPVIKLGAATAAARKPHAAQASTSPAKAAGAGGAPSAQQSGGAVAAVGGGDSDDDFFLSGDEEEEEAGQLQPAPGAGRPSAAAGLVARAWQKPQQEAAASSSEDDEPGPSGQDAKQQAWAAQTAAADISEGAGQPRGKHKPRSAKRHKASGQPAALQQQQQGKHAAAVAPPARGGAKAPQKQPQQHQQAQAQHDDNGQQDGKKRRRKRRNKDKDLD